MGLMGRYIDALPASARDRLITAQEWCVAGVLGQGGSRCLVGHAEDWRELALGPGDWRSWMDGETGGAERGGEHAVACRAELFAFRRARPADLEVYRARVARWGLASEGRIGARFDRLCARRGIAEAVRLTKRRAGREFAMAPLLSRQASRGSSPSPSIRTRTRSSSRSSGTP